MKNQFLDLGKALNKAEQQKINGGQVGESCLFDWQCGGKQLCVRWVCTDASPIV